MRAFVTALVILFCSVLSFSIQASELPKLQVSVLKSGTVNWELQHLANQGLDKKHGFELVINKVASLSAARLALTSDSTDLIVSDWLWAAKRNNQGEQLKFIPFSSQIGRVMRAKDSRVNDLAQLKGKTIGVAGGPMNKGWVLLQAAARQQNVHLAKEAKIQFGAPPLLSQALKRGQIDLLVTFWHYGAQLEVDGYDSMLSLTDLMKQMGMETQVPMLGYLYKSNKAEVQPELYQAFANAIAETKVQLVESDQVWLSLRDLMKVGDNDALYQAYIQGYRQGVPGELSADQIADAQRFYQLIDSLNPYPSNEQLSESLFFRPAQ